MADKYATEIYCQRLGGFTTAASDKLVLENDLNRYNCELISSPSKQYTETQCVLQKDIKRNDGTVVDIVAYVYGGDPQSEVGASCMATIWRNLEGYGEWHISSYDMDISAPFDTRNQSCWNPYWVGGSQTTSEDNYVEVTKVIYLTDTIVVTTKDYYESTDFVLARADAYIEITYLDGETTRKNISYGRSYREVGSKDGKYKYEITFVSIGTPYAATKNKQIKNIFISFEIFAQP